MAIATLRTNASTARSAQELNTPFTSETTRPITTDPWADPTLPDVLMGDYDDDDEDDDFFDDDAGEGGGDDFEEDDDFLDDEEEETLDDGEESDDDDDDL